MPGEEGTNTSTTTTEQKPAQTGANDGQSNLGIQFSPGTPHETQTAHFQITDPETKKAPTFQVPDEYKDEEWVQNILKTDNPVEGFFKQFKNAQNLIGSRQNGALQVPGENATPEQVKDFHKKLGVPDTIDGYKLEPVQWDPVDKPLAEYLASTRNDNFMNALKTAAQSAGVTPKQFQALANAYDKAFVSEHRQVIEKQVNEYQETSVDFDKQAAALLGSRKDQVLDNGKKIFTANIPENMRAFSHILHDPKEVSNRALLMFAGVLDTLRSKYMREDSFSTAQGVSTGGLTKEQISAKGKKLMATEEYQNPLHAEHADRVKEVNELYARLGSQPKT